MADVYQRIVELLDNSQYLAALEKAEEQERTLAAVRTAGGPAAVKALRAVETAHKAEEKALGKTLAANESYLSALLRLQEQAAGLSSEQRSLNEFIRATDAAMKTGTITAQQYADAQGAIKARQVQLTASANTASAGLNTMTASAGASRAGLLNLSRQVQDVVVGLAGGQGLGMVALQQGSQIGDAFASTPGLFRSVAAGAVGIGSAIGAVAVPLGSVLIPLWLDYTKAQEAATAAAEAWNAAQEAALPLIDKAAQDVSKLTALVQASATLEETRTKIARAYSDQLDETNAPTKKQIALLEQQIATMPKTSAAYIATYDSIKALKGVVEENNRAAAEGVLAAVAMAEYNYEEAESDRVLAARKKAATEARKGSKDAARAEREEEARIEEINRYLLEHLKLIEQTEAAFDKLHNAAILRNATDLEQIALQAEAQRQALTAAAVEAMTAQDSADQKLRIRRELNEALRAVNAQELADYTALKAKEQEAAEKAARAAARAQLDLAEGALGQASDTAAEISEAIGARNEDAARTAWGISQSLAVAQGTLAAIKAGAETAAQVAAIPGGQPFAVPAGLAMWAAVEAALVAKMAATPAPTFSDTPPGGWKPTPTQRTASFAADDTVIAARDPQELVRQAVSAAVDRQMARPPARPARRDRTQAPPVSRLLTSDLGLTVRGRA